MASGPITLWQIDGETVRNFILLGSKITGDGDCSREIKRHLLLGRKAMTYLDSMFKSRVITWPTKLCLVKAVFLPVVMYGCESWTIKKGEHWRIDAFELWCWRLESSLDCKETQPVDPEGNQSWIFIGRADAEAETPILCHLMRRADSFEKSPCWERLKVGGEGDDKGWDGWMAPPTQWAWVWVYSRSW